MYARMCMLKSKIGMCVFIAEVKDGYSVSSSTNLHLIFFFEIDNFPNLEFVFWLDQLAFELLDCPASVSLVLGL